MKGKLVVLCLIIVFNFGYAQTYISYKWKNCYGGAAPDVAYSIQQTFDGGFIAAGLSESGDVTNNHGSTDYWVTKLDNTGVIQWENSYGGSYFDNAYSIAPTTDWGYIIAGSSNSIDGDVTNNKGSADCWIVKINELGAIEWEKSYGGSAIDYANCIQQTTDGGYIFAGFTMSNDGDVTGNHGSFDAWVVKINASGAIQWQRSYGGSSGEYAQSIQQTIDGGYIVAGSSYSNDGDSIVNIGGSDYWIIKIDALGAIQWQKSYGGSNDDFANSIQQTSDGGYVIAGSSESNNGDVIGNHGLGDSWIVKINALGVTQWQKCFGGSSIDAANCIKQTADNGFIIANSSLSNDGDITNNKGSNDIWIIKTDQSGNVQWSDNYGGSSGDGANCVLQSSDGSYIIAGSTGSEDGDVTGNHGSGDYWVLNLCLADSVFIAISNQSYCHFTTLTATGGFADYLWSDGQTTQSIDISKGGIYSVIAKNSSGCTSYNEINVLNPILPFNGEQICLVTLDEQSGKNSVIIEKTMNVGIDSILIFRLDNLSSEYIPIGSIGIYDNSYFVDENAIPAQQSYQYKISVKDTCGNESNLSEVHRTILLQSSAGVNKEVNLNWNPYVGFVYPNFEIYRRTDNGIFTLIANVPNNTYTFTDLAPPSGSNRYQVRVTKEMSCNPVKSTYAYVSSNIVNPNTIGIVDKPAISFSIQPNPVTDRLSLRSNSDLLGAKYIIADLTGRVLLTGNVTAEDIDINLSELSAGMYTLRIEGESNQAIKIIKK